MSRESPRSPRDIPPLRSPRGTPFFKIIHVGNEDLCTTLDKGSESKDEKRCEIISVVLKLNWFVQFWPGKKPQITNCGKGLLSYQRLVWVYNLLLVCRKTKLHLQCLLRKRWHLVKRMPSKNRVEHRIPVCSSLSCWFSLSYYFCKSGDIPSPREVWHEHAMSPTTIAKHNLEIDLDKGKIEGLPLAGTRSSFYRLRPVTNRLFFLAELLHWLYLNESGLGGIRASPKLKSVRRFSFLCATLIF